MKNDIERVYLIDKFLKGELSGPSLDEFKNRIRTSKEFSEEVESQKAIIEGIKLARREHLLSVLKGEKAPSANAPDEAIAKVKEPEILENTYKSAVEPETEHRIRVNYNSWIYAAAAVLFAGLFLYFFLGYYLPRQNGELANTDSSNVSQPETIQRETHKSSDVPKNQNPELTPDSTNTQGTIANNQMEPTSPSDTLNIEKDRKLADQNLVVPALELVNNSDLKNDNSNVSNGDAGTKLRLGSVKKVKGVTVNIEYWQSVVKFKGYKLKENRLQLFDVKPEENVNLEYLDNQLFLKRSGTYYKLVPSGNFEQYQKETNPDIIKTLESN